MRIRSTGNFGAFVGVVPPIHRADISERRAGKARPLALPLGELARLKAVTERAGLHPVISLRRAGKARPLALLLGELARRKP